MYSFKNDYSEGAHPMLLQAMLEANLEQNPGYGEDSHSLNAARLIKEKIDLPDTDVHFLMGGTQTNLAAISAFLRPHQAVISAYSGHINTHETGAIEGTGHKVLTRKTPDGKLTPGMILSILDEHTDEHMVQPKMVYISNSTEVGTIYSKAELSALHNICRQRSLYLYMDGARLGSALCAHDNDLEISDIAALVDAFYIGGTKNGALCGEALVICNEALQEDFRYLMKQKGGLAAKGFLLGIQFEQLFQNELYYDLAHHANDMALLLSTGIGECGYEFFAPSTTNQIFPIFPYAVIQKLEEEFSFYMWTGVDETHGAIRLVTSWATKEGEVKRFVQHLKNISLH